MFRGFGRNIKRSVRRHSARTQRISGRERGFPVCEMILTLMLGLCVGVTAIILFGVQMRPLAAAAAKAQTQNVVNRLVEEIVLTDLGQRPLGYRDFVTIQRDGKGMITALTTNMAAMNLLRAELLNQLLTEMDGIRVEDIHIPLGSLLGIDLLWGKGPRLKIQGMSVGTVRAEFESEFTGAGVNQTLHRIWLEVVVPLTLILPGEPIETQVDTRLCVAETVIVGQVPDTYLQSTR